MLQDLLLIQNDDTNKAIISFNDGNVFIVHVMFYNTKRCLLLLKNQGLRFCFEILLAQKRRWS